MEVLAKRLKWLREKMRLSQREVANEIGMTVSGYQKIEYDLRDPKLDVLVKLAKSFDVSTDFLLGLTNYTKDYEDYHSNLRKLQTEIQSIGSKTTIISSRISDIEEEILKLDKNFAYQDTEYRNKMEKLQYELITLKNEKNALEKSSQIFIKEYRLMIEEYIDYLLELPCPNPKKDQMLIMLSPMNIEVIENTNSYAIEINTKLGVSKYLDFIPSKEEAEQLREKISKILIGE